MAAKHVARLTLPDLRVGFSVPDLRVGFSVPDLCVGFSVLCCHVVMPT